MADEHLANRYRIVVEKIKQLAVHDRYEGAVVFGSFATGELHPESDLDVSVLVTDEQVCSNVSHPLLDGIRVDISFDSMAKLVQMAEERLKQGFRKPWLYDSVILFDKQGRLQQLKARVLREAQPLAGERLDADTVQFEMYYKYTKPRKYLAKAPATANLIMHLHLSEVLRVHYKFRRRWWVSDKKLFSDLAAWDPTMGKLLEEFVTEPVIEQKYRLWREMIEHVLLAIGGSAFERFEVSCDCERCQADVQRLLALFS